METELTILRDYEPQPIGSIIEYDSKQLQVAEEFIHGFKARQSGYKYFINSPKGVCGLKEVI